MLWHIGADFHRPVMATALGEKNSPYRTPPCEELSPPYDIKLVFFVQKITFVLRKIKKTAAARAALFDSYMNQIVFYRLAASPRPHCGSLQRSPDPLAVFRGPNSKGRGEEGRKGVRPLT